MECIVVHTKKYLFYKVIKNNTISSDEFGLFSYRKIVCVMWRMQMWSLSSGFISVI